MTEKTKKWNDEAVTYLQEQAAKEVPVSAATVEKIAEHLGFSTRSVASKLRQLDFEVASMAQVKTSPFSDAQTAALTKLVKNNPGKFTYKEIAEDFEDGAFTAKQIQGKLLALELTANVKPAEKVEALRSYSAEEEQKFIKMVQGGKFIEDIAASLNRSIPSVRGKALSLTRNGQIDKIPAQRESHAQTVVDPVASLGAKIATMTVAEIAAAVDKTERGIKTLLTRRGIAVADYDGAAKKAKAEAKAVAA